jgi:hypothetical protein
VNWDLVEATLAGQHPDDLLGEPEQEAVRQRWQELIDTGIDNLDLCAQFHAEGRTRWSEANPSGDVHLCHDPEDLDDRDPDSEPPR